jgi:hypothetical protein
MQEQQAPSSGLFLWDTDEDKTREILASLGVHGGAHPGFKFWPMLTYSETMATLLEIKVVMTTAFIIL